MHSCWTGKNTHLVAAVSCENCNVYINLEYACTRAVSHNLNFVYVCGRLPTSVVLLTKPRSKASLEMWEWIDNSILRLQVSWTISSSGLWMVSSGDKYVPIMRDAVSQFQPAGSPQPSKVTQAGLNMLNWLAIVLLEIRYSCPGQCPNFELTNVKYRLQWISTPEQQHVYSGCTFFSLYSQAVYC